MFEMISQNLANVDWVTHGLIFAVNLLLLFFSGPIIDRIDPGHDHSASTKFFVMVNVVFLVLHVVDLILLSINLNYTEIFIKLAGSAVILYVSILFYKVGSIFFRRRFGTKKEFDHETIYLDTYSSRVVGILHLIVTSFFTIYLLIQVWGLNSWLETTGIFGIIIGFLALTSSVWAPDIVSGLIILNSKILEDGDVVVIDGYPDEYIIHKVSFIHTILYDIRNNHRTFIRNKRFIESKIDNLSRVASTEGIRKAIVYNIGYPDLSSMKHDERMEAFTYFESRVDKLFNTAYELALATKDLKIKTKTPFEWRLTNTGDYALQYTLFVYLEAVPTTKITANARKHLLSSLFTINQLMLKASAMTGVQLQTPDLLSVEHKAIQGASQKETAIG